MSLIGITVSLISLLVLICVTRFLIVNCLWKKPSICNYHRTRLNKIWNPFNAQFWKPFNQLFMRLRKCWKSSPGQSDIVDDIVVRHSRGADYVEVSHGNPDENLPYPKTACSICVDGKVL